MAQRSSDEWLKDLLSKTCSIEDVCRDISLTFKANEAQGIREWGELFERCFRIYRLDWCTPLLQEVKRRYTELCISCRAQIRLAEGELCQKKNHLAKAKRCYEDSLELQRKLVRQAEKAAHQTEITGSKAEIAGCKLRLEIHKVDLARCLHQLGKLDFDQGRYQSAERNYQHAVELWRDIRSPEGLAASLIGAGEVYRVLGKYQHAKECLLEALTRAKEAGDDAYIADAQHYLGLIRIRQAHLAKARGWFKKSLEIAKQRDDKFRMAAARYQLGVIAQASSCYGEALQHYDAVIILADDFAHELDDKHKGNETGFNTPPNVFNDLAGQARHFAADSTAIPKEPFNDPFLVMKAASYHQRGMIHHAEGDYTQAKDQYDVALRWWKKLGDKLREAQTYYQLGLLYHEKGDDTAAKKRYRASFKVARKIRDKPGEAWTLYQWGILYQDKGADALASKCYQKSFAVAHDIDDRATQARVFHQLGIIERGKGSYDKARELYERTLAIRRKIDDKLGEAQTLYQLGILDQLQKKYAQARIWYKACLAVERKIVDNQGIATTLYQLGVLHQATGKLDDARQCLEEALALWENCGPMVGIAHTQTKLCSNYLLGKICLQQGDFEQAQKSFQDPPLCQYE